MWTERNNKVTPMQRKKITIIVIACAALCILALRELGILDVNAYKSILDTSYSASLSRSNVQETTSLSYTVDIRHQQETLVSLTKTQNGSALLAIEAILEEPEYSGGYGYPLVKVFTMAYQCVITSSPTAEGQAVTGTINGEIEARITGFCTGRKAKALALEKAIQQIEDYLWQQLKL